ncbi:beta-lactamase family [Fusarium albosuccineum]|uniref:Beta-lactamase family n=1 Tax=Fusarium albosuccineum TaxID=1237068 RepID=A0A8H4L510_9HYPO|nr:beta-lactamase family [Fusarium albosuccineum]
MFSRNTLVTLLPLLGSPVWADHLGPRYPPPRDLTSKGSIVAASWENFTATLDEGLKVTPKDATKNAALAEWIQFQNVTFSVGVFSTRDDKAASQLQYHYSSPLTNEAEFGTKNVSGDTIYGIASITKLFTIYSALMNLDEGDWERPLTHFFPQLADTAKKAKGNPTEHIQWDTITPLALANQIAGLPRDGWPLSPGEMITNAIADPESNYELGFPPLDIHKDPILSTIPCNDYMDASSEGFVLCADGFDEYDNYVESQEQRPPTFLPWTTPAYSNTGFVILGAILQNVTGKNIDELFPDGLFDPLDMSRTFTQTPPKDKWDNFVIPGNETNVAALEPLNTTKSSGALMSTTNDLAKFGTSILNHTLLSGDVTRKWMRPRSHTARLDYSVGAPWEIPRFVDPETGVVTDIYTKSGQGSLYAGFFGLVPEFDIGFSILAAHTDANLALSAAGTVGDVLANTLIPAMLKQAAAEAASNFEGTYVSTKEGLNSSITITRNKTEGAPPGLTISSFISNGSDYVSLMSQGNPKIAQTRLVPTVIDDKKSGKIAMRALTGLDAPKEKTGPFSSLISSDWILAGSGSYGAVDTELFIFDVDEDGKATAVSPLAFRVKLERNDY